MILRKKVLVWNIIDTITTFCFMIYLNFKLPFNVEELFYFFNLKRFGLSGKIFWFLIDDTIVGQEASAGFHNRGKSTLFLANNDLLIFLTAVICFALCLKPDKKIRIINICFLKWVVFALLQMTNISFASWYCIISFVLAFLTLVSLILLPIGIVRLLKKGDIKD